MDEFEHLRQMERENSKKRRGIGRVIELAMFIIAVLALEFVLNEFGLTPLLNSFVLREIPAYEGTAYSYVNDNTPLFTAEDVVTQAYEFYSEQDELGRCGYAMACIGKELMPTEERESISHVKPSGWAQAEYDIVEGKSLYNRCHLIGFQLTGENANRNNLITGTRYMNTQGMLPFENMVADYIKETGNHVIYRVTPVYEENNLLASGVRIEAMSVEDEGEGIFFHVYVYNVQPGVEIDYATGESRLAPDK